MEPGASLAKRALIPVTLLLSFAIFLYYLSRNYGASYWDESGYLKLAHRILGFGIFNIHDDLRTYLYPTLVAGSLLVTGGHAAAAKVVMAFLLYGLYLTTVFYVARRTFSVFQNEAVRRIMLVLGCLNPYLLQACSLYLTDSVATSLGAIALFTALTADLNRPRNVVLSYSLVYAAVMIRPASLIFFPIMLAITALRYGIGKTPWLRPSFILINLASIGLVFLPQVYNNYVYFHILSFLIPYNLYAAQVAYGIQYVKYATVVAVGQIPGLKYVNPFVPPIGRITEIVHHVTPKNVAFAGVAHLFGALDWGYVDTYIANFYPLSRILGSLFLYPCWILAAGTMPGALAPARVAPERPREVTQLLRMILMAAAVYLAFIGTTQVESRFGYPVFLLLLPLMGLGLLNLARVGKAGLMTRVLALVAVILVLFAASFSFDRLTGRIFWGDHFKGMLSARSVAPR